MKKSIFLILLIVLLTTSCNSQVRSPHELASFTENEVTVSIYLNKSKDGETFLSAKFSPPDGYHLYSKDIPLTGVDGLGRPTLLELTTESEIISLGELSESVSAEVPNFEPKELLVYPSGAVTLSMTIDLPNEDGWLNDAVKVTYMACNDGGCKAPVIGKLVSVRIPGANLFE
jgi:hypothetical protein